jgi:MFS family permease
MTTEYTSPDQIFEQRGQAERDMKALRHELAEQTVSALRPQQTKRAGTASQRNGLAGDKVGLAPGGGVGTMPPTSGRWSLAWLNADGKRLLVTRLLRTFGYGYLAVVLGLYLQQLGFDPSHVGIVLTGAIAGSAVMTISWSLVADRYGRRRTMQTVALLMVLGGLLFALTDNFWLLLLGALTGTISATSSEVGPFVTVEQAALPQTAPAERRTWLFSIYEMLGNFAGAAGALCAGTIGLFAAWGLSGADAYRPLFLLYAALGLANFLLFRGLSDRVELARVDGKKKFTGLHRSGGRVARFTALIGLDAFAGGFVVHSLVAYWFHLRWGLEPAMLGVIFFWVGVLSGLSFLAAGLLSQRFGLLRTMVFAHLPSNLLLALVPLAPFPWLAVLLFLARESIAQMDEPMRKSYTMAVVEPDERTAAAGITNGVRSIAKAVSPAFTGLAFSVAALGLPFYLAGGLKISYDLLMYATFRHVRPPEEEARHQSKLAASIRDAEVSVNGYLGSHADTIAEPRALHGRTIEQIQPAAY